MIVKEAVISLTDEEVHSPEPIEIHVKVKMLEGDIDYTINIPKGEEE
jgi:hypothetical protein